MYARLRCGGNLPLCVRGLGTRNRLLRYGICVRCSKRLPVVRDASSEALGAQNRLFRYRRDIRYRKRPPTVRDASSKVRRTADSTDCGQPLPHRTHLQCAKRPPLSLFAPAAPSPAPSTALGTRNGPRSDVSRHKKRVTSKSIKTF